MSVSELTAPLPTQTVNGKARETALNAVAVEITPTSVVGYSSTGRVLVIGSEIDIEKPIQKLADAGIKCYSLVTRIKTEDRDEQASFIINFQSTEYELTGYLGAFQAISTANDRRMNLGLYTGLESGNFDIVVELSDQPSIPAEVSPPGYYWIGDDQNRKTRIREVLEEVPELVGNFEKPKFFNYDPDICAHSRSGIVACTRCIDACPTDAIGSNNDIIEVNPHLCQGGGSCSTACPTGAITYAYPVSENLQEILRQLLQHYRNAGGDSPILLFYDKEHGKSLVEESIANMSENLLPVQVEEVGSLGLDVYFSAFAYGASDIRILLTQETPASVQQELKCQLEILNALLNSLGQTDELVELLDQSTFGEQLNSISSELFEIPPASFAPVGMKRTDIRTALEHLHDNAPKKPQTVDLPSHAPFGEIKVDTQTCTLCMGCVSVCPASALEAGGDTPKLSFIEHNCVQCGLCETACPENSITRNQRYLFNTDERMRSRTLNEDAPFHCRMCGKPFATSAMIDKMRDKLKGHWMFEKNKEAMMRLEMCEDCRVKDMFAAEGGFPREKI